MELDLTEQLRRAKDAPDRKDRREAFLGLLASEGWREALSPELIARQSFRVRDTDYPDLRTIADAAALLASSEEKVQAALELPGTDRYSNELLGALARQTPELIVELCLAHVRTAERQRVLVLQRLLHEADARWVERPEAKRVIRKLLRVADDGRVELMQWLAEAGALSRFVDELKVHPPLLLDEWSAMGRAQVRDAELELRALALLPHTHGPLLYLMRLDPLPEGLEERVLAAARPDWLPGALEAAVVDGLAHPLLVPLAELAVRQGGRSMAVAVAWIGSSKMAKEVLGQLGGELERDGQRVRLSDTFWIRRSGVSGDRALERGRRGQVPDPLDVAALVRQMRGERISELVHEILGTPRLNMFETVLRPLCAVHPEAAELVAAMCASPESDVARLAHEAVQWPDVVWPEVELE
ncbi:MAG: hypothetical protein IT371_31395 [Deltaproteobacteria bacterium]|nr:hypothetical protein [Deltaproteobacteria bacterium]